MKTKTQFLIGGMALAVFFKAAAQPATNSTFTKITAGAIVNDGGSSYGCAWGDYDNDGFIDLVVANGWGQHDFLYRNNGDGTFTKITTGPVVESASDSVAAIWGDYDNDGFLDLFISVFFDPAGDLLYHNNRDGTFTRITTGPVPNDSSRGVGAAWVDYNRDGMLDLFVANSVQQNEFLYRGNGDGDFAKIALGPLVTAGGNSFGCAWGDFNGDGAPDAMVTGPNNFLFVNDGSGNFTRLISGPGAAGGVGAAWGDYDNDGDLDLIVADEHTLHLYQNDSHGNFALVRTGAVATDNRHAGGVAWGDYDNDGWPDLFVSGGSPEATALAAPNRLYHNRGDGSFEAVSEGAIATDGQGSLACAWGDYDNDGFLDLFVANTGDSEVTGPVEMNNYLYRNDGNSNRWLMLKLVGSASNRSAIGAKVRLQATIGGQTFWQLREISGGSGYCSQNDMRAHFGLGDATNADLVRIDWPSGTVQELRRVTANQIVTVNEPSVLAALGQTEAGAFPLSLKGRRGQVYTIEQSTNLTHWLSLTNFSATNVVTPISLPDVTSTSTRFYRAREGD